MKTISPQQAETQTLYRPGIKGSISFAVPEASSNKLNIRFHLTAEGFNETGEANESLTTQIKTAIDGLSACNRSDKMRQLFQISEIIELVILKVTETEATKKPLQTVKTYDVCKLREAKNIVENNLAKPYSLKNLAHKVGLNDFKLKKGFKELFGFTVFGYLRELRMLKAKKLLLAEKDTVTYVSSEVGYQHPHHFSTAFKKRFGILPGALIK